jgi:hypothetical protein
MADGIRLGGAYYELTADDSKLIQALARTQSQAKSFGEATARAMGVASGSTDAAMKKMAASTQQAGRGFSELGKQALEMGATLTGVTLGVAGLAKALQTVGEVTAAAAQAQRQLNAVYGAGAPIQKAYADALGKATGLQSASIQAGLARIGALQKNFALTTAEVQTLTKAGVDLAAVFGGDVNEAFQALNAGVRGEAESLEKFGIFIQDSSIKTTQAFKNLTAEEQKHWETLDEVTKARVRYNAIMEQAAKVDGAAAQRAKDGTGALQNLETATKNLALTLGERAAPAFNTWAQAIADVITRMDELIKKNAELATAPFAPAAITDLDAQIRARIGAPPAPGSAAAQAPGRLPGPGIDPAEIAAMDATEAANRKAAADRALADAKNAARAQLDVADDLNKKTVEAQIKAIDAERKAKEQWYDEERQRIEARRTYELEDIETRKDAAINALQAEKQAALDAIDDEIKQQERLKQVRLDAAKAAADAARTAIEAEKQRLDISREIEDRSRADQRLAEDRALDAARLQADRSRKTSEEDELRGLKALTDARKDAVAAGIAALERATEKRIAALDREAERARANGQQALTRLERQGEAEDELHRTRMQALDDEKDARTALLDMQLAALDAEQKTSEAARRTADLQKRVADAQKAQVAAKGTGTPDQIAQARDELTRAFKVGNELSIANARERLAQLAGQGNEAIQKADEELAAAQQDLRDEGVAETRDAEKEKLKAAKDAIADEIDARKRVEDDADRARKQDLELQQEAERGKLQATLSRIEKQKAAVQEDAKATETKLRKEEADAEKAAEKQVQITKDRYEQEGQALDDARSAEDQVRADQRKDEDRIRKDARDEQDRDLSRQLAAIQVELDAEERATEEHYNGPNGVVTKLKKARTDSEREYSARLAAVTVSYEAERKAAERKYTNPEGNGELQLLEKQRKAEMDALADRKTEYEEQGKAFHQMIVDMIADLDAFIAKQQSVPKPGGGSGSPGSDARAAGSGKATSASSTTTKSSQSGSQVQGTPGTWLNDALDITGAPDDWVSGLNWILDHENAPRDPHAKNPNSTAAGLFQMIDTTFADSRDTSLPNNVLDPVANAVAAIRYIKKRYGSPEKAIDFWKANHWYDAGGLITEPVLGRGLRSGRPYAIGEYGPEYVLGRRATSAMLAGGAGSASGGMGGWLAGAHPGGGGYVDNSAVNFYGLTYEQATVKQRREQHRRTLLHGARRLR